MTVYCIYDNQNTTKDKPSSNINVALQYFIYLKLSSALVSI